MVESDRSGGNASGKSSSSVSAKYTIANSGIDAPGFSYQLPQVLRPFENFVKTLFSMEERKVTVLSELFAGFVLFLSCSYTLVVIPSLMINAGYPVNNSYRIVALISAIGSILSGIVSNTPFAVAPGASGTILLSVYIRDQGMTINESNRGVLVSGLLFVALGYRPISRLFTRLVPNCVQISLSIGIGLMTSLAGCIEAGIIERGKYTIIAAGDLTPTAFIAMFGVVLIALCLHFHLKAAFSIALVFCSLVYWGHYDEWPQTITGSPVITFSNPFESDSGLDNKTVLLIFNLFFLHGIAINGIARAFGDLAGITSPTGTVPRARWLYIICGLMEFLSGFCGGPPAGICPESGAGIKAGARTGLSAVFCGIFFGVSIFFTPLFSCIPFAGTAPLLIAIGCILFSNTSKIDWSDAKVAYPAYVTLFFIPFTYNILTGTLYGWVTYLIMAFFSGDIRKNAEEILAHYTPTRPWRTYFTCTYLLTHLWHNTLQLDDDMVNDQELHSFISWPHYGTDMGFDLFRHMFPRFYAPHQAAGAWTGGPNEESGRASSSGRMEGSISTENDGHNLLSDHDPEPASTSDRSDGQTVDVEGPFVSM